MHEKDFYHPNSTEYYEARTSRDATIIQLSLERLRVPFTPMSFNDRGQFIERFYVKLNEGHTVANEAMIIDLELSVGKDKWLLEQFERSLKEKQRYY